MRNLLLVFLLSFIGFSASAQKDAKPAQPAVNAKTPAEIIVSPKEFSGAFSVSVNFAEKKTFKVHVLDDKKNVVFENAFELADKTSFKVSLDDKPAGKYRIIFTGTNDRVIYSETITKL
ncbi:DUF3244 domain-containing protein [Flavobacterium sp.]|uniref:DUF3244 domain-containing protein n=1 Tax=Flavobacterium sp. TaxID=239 RepID=UPI001207D89A|nr:DUF3244 domain-containing protein [Flavobacterium sp.]RZJ69439.1 MAG: hypothetical protein EOO49_17540 [Flavobacterium sp.]